MIVWYHEDLTASCPRVKTGLDNVQCGLFNMKLSTAAILSGKFLMVQHVKRAAYKMEMLKKSVSVLHCNSCMARKLLQHVELGNSFEIRNTTYVKQKGACNGDA